MMRPRRLALVIVIFVLGLLIVIGLHEGLGLYLYSEPSTPLKCWISHHLLHRPCLEEID